MSALGRKRTLATHSGDLVHAYTGGHIRSMLADKLAASGFHALHATAKYLT